MSSKIPVLGRTTFAVALVMMLIAVAASPAMMVARADDSNQVHTDALPVISWITANVSAQRIYSTLYDLQNYSTRYIYTTNCNASAQYIYRDFSNSSNLIVQSQYFLYGGYMLRNVVATLPGLNPANKTVYVIGGHYDSVTYGAGADPMVWAPGADDDGSGTVATMEVARVLSNYKFNATLMFSAWTAEEVGLVGSDYQASVAKKDGMQIGAVIDMDMIGNYATTMGLDLVHDGLSEWIADALVSANTDYGIGLTLSKSYNTAQNSDHAAFWAYGYNAIMAAEADFSPHWHKNTDTIDNVNLDLITRTAKLGAAGIAELAGIIQPGYGAIYLDRAVYRPGNVANITLYDTDLNVNPAVRETAVVTIFSDTEPAGESVTLMENGPDTSVFTGAIELISGLPVAGKLEVNNDDKIHVDYFDADPGAMRSAWARIDSVPPEITNVYAIPDVDSAIINWTTNEASDSTVLYGENPVLGQNANSSNLVVSHSVLLFGLKPGTLYYYDVQSADVVGNTALSDNGGNHYTFVTLTGSVGRGRYGYVGYVREVDPSINYFTSPKIMVGEGITGRNYLGGAQLDTSMNPIPQNAVIESATFDILGMGWVDNSDLRGPYTLMLLNSSIDTGWTTKGYTDISAAAVDATIPPALDWADVGAGIRNVFTFQPSQYDLLRSHFNSGRISFRINGPTTPYVVFQWYSGNEVDPRERARVMPRLTVLYSLTGDVQGPSVTSLYADPNPTMSASSSVVHITLSDITTGGSNLSYAEYFWGADPGIGRAMPLLADDGGYDTPMENATFTLNVSTMPVGMYTMSVRGCDQAGNWGPVRVLTLYVGVWDLYAPVIDSLSFIPAQPESGSPVNISARITDDIAVYGASVDIIDFDGFPRGNFTMSYDPMSARYFVNLAYDTLGRYTATVWANDTSNKWNHTAGTFAVIDTTDPVIHETNATPSIQDYGYSVFFSAWVTDKFIDNVFIIFRDPSGASIGNFTTIRVGPPGDNYTFTTTFQTLGLWTYCFSAVDTSGNWATTCGNFRVVDRFPPVIVSATATPSPQDYGRDVLLKAWVTDLAVSSVWANITGPGLAPIGNFSMTRTAPSDDNWTLTQPYSILGVYSFTIWAFDASGNPVSVQKLFEIVDRTPPVFNTHQATPNPAEVLTSVRITANVADFQLASVTVEIRNPSGVPLVNTTMDFNATSGEFEYDFPSQVIGRHTYSLWAVDTSGNGAVLLSDFIVQDATRPTVTLVSAVRVLAEDHNDVNVTVSIQDNYALDVASLKIEWRDPSGSLITNSSLVHIGASDYSFDYPLLAAGTNRYTVSALDTSGNVAVLQGQVNVVLGLPPNAVAGTDQSVSTGTSLYFNASGSSDDFGIVRYSWHIVGPDANATLEGLNVSYTFNSSGTYQVTLTVYDSANHASSASVTVSVSSPKKEGGIDASIILLVALAVIVTVVLLALLFLQKRRKKEEPKGEERAEEESKGD